MKERIVEILNRYFESGPNGRKPEYDAAFSAQEAVEAIAEIVEYEMN